LDHRPAVQVGRDRGKASATGGGEARRQVRRR